LKDPFVERGIAPGGILPAGWVNSKVIKCFFLRTPGKLESSQTVVLAICTTEMQSFGALAREELNALPHNKIVGAEFLKSVVRRAIFIQSILSKMEEDRGGYLPIPALRQNSKTTAGFDNVLVNV